MRWWNTDDWRLQQETVWVDFPVTHPSSGFPQVSIDNVQKWPSDEVLIVQVRKGITDFPHYGTGVVARNLPKPIVGKSDNYVRISPNETLAAFDVNEIYDIRDGQRLSLPAGHKFCSPN